MSSSGWDQREGVLNAFENLPHSILERQMLSMMAKQVCNRRMEASFFHGMLYQQAEFLLILGGSFKSVFIH